VVWLAVAWPSVEAEAWETPRSSTGIPSVAAQTQARAQNSSPETYVNGALHPLTCSTSEGSIKPKLNPNRSTGGLSASDMHQEVVERRISGELAGPGTLTGKEDFSTTRRQPGLCLRFLGNLREVSLRNRLPEGKCIYIQSGDPSDFDGEHPTLLSCIRPKDRACWTELLGCAVSRWIDRWFP
jgi:hypothetical protein